METYLLPFLGIVVSVGLFLLGYRQTVGVRKERVRVANTELEKVLLRRIVLESYNPAIDDLSRLINGKARDHRVRPRDLLSEEQLLETVFTRIIESDFVTPNQRNEILERLSPVLLKAEEASMQEIRVAELPSSRKQLYSPVIITMIMAVFASLIGALVVLLPRLRETGEFLTLSTFIAFSVSLIVISLIYFTYRIRESQEETSSKSALQSAIDFEEEVGRVLRKRGATLELGAPGLGFDFMATVGKKKILVEVKAWSRRVPISSIRHVVTRLSQAIEAIGADEAIIVTKAPLALPPDSLKDTRIRVMSLRELRNYMVHGGV